MLTTIVCFVALAGVPNAKPQRIEVTFIGDMSEIFLREHPGKLQEQVCAHLAEAIELSQDVF